MRETVRHTAGHVVPGGLDDAALITRSLRVPDCFGELFDRHAATIHRYITSRLGPGAADDLVSETFLAAFRKRDRYDSTQPSALPWLFGMATLLIGRHRRDEARFLRAIARSGVDPATEPAAERAVERVAAQSLSRDLAAALAGLSHDHRDVLLLIASGLGPAEAARALGVPAGTVSSRLARARRNVRKTLGDGSPAITGEE
jgi:RNA polymerase sigma factor (sigma-70 family)